MPPDESGHILQYGFLICQWGCAKYLNALQLFPPPAVLKSSSNERDDTGGGTTAVGSAGFEC